MIIIIEQELARTYCYLHEWSGINVVFAVHAYIKLQEMNDANDANEAAKYMYMCTHSHRLC